MTKISINILDDHKIFCEGLKIILESKENLEVLKIFSTAEEALEALNFERPDIIISDITLPNINGIEFTRKVKSKFGQIKILILSMHNTSNYVKEALEAGVHGYIPKDSKAEEVFNAIQMIMNDKIYVSPVISATVLNFKKNNIELTPREIDVLQQIALGHSTQIIADKLFISTHTVETHRKNMLTKTGCTNSVDLSMWGVDKGYIKSKNY